MLYLDIENHQQTVALGADHAGFELKEQLKVYLQAQHFKVKDVGTHSTDSVDYTDFAHTVAALVQDRNVDYGVLVCGTGLGMAMAANRHDGVRAAVCPSSDHARLGRSHNDANVLCLGGRLTPYTLAEDIMSIFLTTPFEGGRHQRRVSKISP